MAFYAPFPGSGLSGSFVSAGSAGNVGAVSGLSFGTPSTNRYLVAVCSGSFGGGGTIATVTIGGISATIVANLQVGTIQNVIAIAAVPTGTSGTVSTTGNTTGTLFAAVYALYGVGSTTAITTTSSSNPSSMTLSSLLSGSFVIGSTVVDGTVNSWSGVTQDNNQTLSVFAQSVASSGNSGSGNFALSSSMTVTSGSAVSVAAAWHP